MSSLFSSVGVKVSWSGEVRDQFGRRFWSMESTQLAGRWATLMLPSRADDFVIIQDAAGREFRADLIADPFMRSKAAQVEEAKRRTSIVRRQAELLVDLIDQRLEEQLRAGNFFCRLAAHLPPGLFKRLFHRAGQPRLDNAEMCADQVPLRVDASLKLAQAIFEHPHAVLQARPHVVPPVLSSPIPSDAKVAAHRLNGDAK